MLLNKVDCGKNAPTTILSSLTASYFFKIRDAAYSIMPWLIAPYEGSQPLGGKNDVGNYQLQNQGKLLRGLLIR